MCCAQCENSLFSPHAPWLMNKCKAITDSNTTNTTSWIKINSPASGQMRSEVGNKKTDAQEMHRNSNFLV